MRTVVLNMQGSLMVDPLFTQISWPEVTITDSEKNPKDAYCIQIVLNWKLMSKNQAGGAKVPILKECHFGKMKLWAVEHFSTYLSSLLGVIAIF